MRRLAAALLVAGCAGAPEGAASVLGVKGPPAGAVLPATGTHADAPADRARGARLRPASPARPELPERTDPLGGKSRPSFRVREFDYESLPILQLDENAKGSSLKVDEKGVFIRADLFAEIDLGGFTLFTGAPFPASGMPPCGPKEEGVIEARWSGFSARSWRDDRMEVHAAEGLYDKATCEATSSRAGSVTAHAIIPGYVYAYRKRAAADAMPGESLVILLPRAPDSSVTALPTRGQEYIHTGAFSRVTLPISAGSGMGFLARLAPSDIDLWQRLYRTRAPVRSSHEVGGDPTAPVEPLYVGVEVAWEGDRRRGTLQLATSTPRAPAFAPVIAAARMPP